MERLLEIGQHCVQAGLPFEACLQEILRVALEFVGAPQGNIQLLDPTSGALELVVQHGFQQPFLDFFARVTREDAAACGKALHSAGRVIVHDVATSAVFSGQPSREVLLAAGVRAVQSTPLISSRGAVLGMLSTHFPQPHTPNDHELRLIDLLARQAADYIERSHSERLLRAHSEAIEALNLEHALDLASMQRLQQISAQLIQANELGDLLGKIMDAALEVTNADKGTLQLMRGGELRIAHQRGFNPDFLEYFRVVEPGEAACGTALQTNERVIVEDVATSAVFQGSAAREVVLSAGVRAVQATPLLSRSGQLVGILSTHYTTVRTPNDRAIRALDILARQAADLIERSLQQEAVLELTHTLQEREEQLRLATDAAEVGLWDVDLVNDTLFWPARVKAMFGISPDVPVSMTDFYAGLHPEDLKRVSAAFAAAVDPQRQALYDVEYRTVGKEDGVIRWVAAKGRGIFEPGGRCVRVIGTAIDISERKQAEQSVQEREKALGLAHAQLGERTAELARFNQAAVGRELRIIDLKGEVNRLTVELGRNPPYPLQFEREPLAPAPCEVEKHTVLENEGLVPTDAILRTELLQERPSRPPDHEVVSRVMMTLVQALSDSPRTILQTLADETLETLDAGSAGLSLLTPDGGQFYWAAIAGAWSPHLGGGTPRRFGPCGDVLDRNVPLLFTHWERRYPYLAEAVPLAEEGLLVPFHVAGKAVGTIWVIAHDTQRKFDREDLRILQSLSKFASAAYQAVEFMGALDDRRAALNLLEEAVQARQLLEESNRKLRESEEALREADQRKTEFLALLGHELRNPLSPISTASELLSRSVGGDSTARTSIDMIKRQTAHLTRLVDDLLDIGRITQGRIQLKRGPLDLARVISQAMESVEPLFRQKQHQVSILSSYESLYVHGDFARLIQCVTNILTNAAKYTDHGGQIRVAMRAEHSRAVIEISDTGTGITPELLPRVFDLFVQSDRTLDRAEGGLGIGLSVVKRLIEMHDGEVIAHSAGVGKGATFEIRLPRIARPKTVRSEDSPPEAPARRVLIVDDNEDAANSLAMLLSIQGHETQAVYSGKDALSRVRSFKPEIALLDIGLPEMNGYELAQRLRAVPHLEGMRLIALTGYGQAEDRQKARAAGFDDHLVKPVDLSALSRTLRGAREVEDD
jgi:PAS domain S-box-containing protein